MQTSTQGGGRNGVSIKHFVTFYSPGTFVSETTSLPIDSWDVDKAVEMSASIQERHGATPYGFFFTTRSNNNDMLDSKEAARSNMYYLGGEVRTVEEVEADNLPDEHILRSNMRFNKWDRVITNNNSWRITLPLREGDVVLPWTEEGETVWA